MDGNGDWTGAYRFLVVNVPEPVSRSIVIGDVVEGEITVPGEEDIYLFDAIAGQNVYFHTQLGGQYDLDWTLTDPSGTSLFDPYSYYEDQGPLVLEATGQYRLVVDGDAEWTGAYRFQTHAVPAPDVRPIAMGQVVSGAIEARRGDRPLDLCSHGGAVGVHRFSVVQRRLCPDSTAGSRRQ